MADWSKIGSRGNVTDRRSFGPTGLAAGGLGITGLAIMLIFNWLGGGNPADILAQVLQSQVQTQPVYNAQEFEGADTYEVFASAVLGSNNDMWREVFASNNMIYDEPKLVLFRGSTHSQCGGATADVGPHYCPLDNTIYLDETFFDQLQERFGAEGGDVAEAYVIAHEVGHHVQNLLGISDQISDNESSIALELQADCFAGLWAYSLKDQGIFMPGEMSEAIDAAAAVGDDRIQSTITGRIDPESWTHGSSEQRMQWFLNGYEKGEVGACDTFGALQ